MDIKYGCAHLRSIEAEDLELLHMLMNSPAVEKMTVGSSFSISKDNQKEWMQRFRNTASALRYMIVIHEQTTLGMIDLHNINWIDRTACLGIKTNPNERNRIKGDVYDAEYALLRYAFHTLGLHRIEAMTLEYNTFSLKLSRSMGFVDEGIMRKKTFKNGKYWDIIVGGLLEEDFVVYEDGTAPWQEGRKRTRSRENG